MKDVEVKKSIVIHGTEINLSELDNEIAFRVFGPFEIFIKEVPEDIELIPQVEVLIKKAKSDRSINKNLLV
jgi:hypothetical protein